MRWYDDMYGFKLDNKKHILNLYITPSFRKSVCFQVHQMDDDSLELFWNFELESRELLPFMREFVKNNNLPERIKVVDLFEDVEFVKALKKKCPVSKSALSKEQIEIIDRVINTGIPIDVKKHYGLDGHSYTIEIFGEKNQIYESWCLLPEEWQVFSPLIEMVVSIAGLDNVRYGNKNY